MAEFLTRHGIVHHLHEIIDEAEDELVLISPYIKANEETKELLKDTKRSTKINVVYGKKELRTKEKAFLENLFITLTYRENLHAKCYLNERQALLTSMNLYDFSMENNDEMGILVSKEDDRELYEKIHRQAMRYIRPAENYKKRSAPKKIAPRRANRARAATKTPTTGVCIRCGKTDLPVDPTKPYCSECYGTWKKFENKDYKENYCHTCGEEYAATLLKPLCLKCFKKYKDVLEFAER